MKSIIRKFRIEGTSGCFEIRSSCFDYYSPRFVIRNCLNDIPKGWKRRVRIFVKGSYWK